MHVEYQKNLGLVIPTGQRKNMKLLMWFNKGRKKEVYYQVTIEYVLGAGN